MENRRRYFVLMIIIGAMFITAFGFLLAFLIMGLSTKYPIVSYILLSAIPILSIAFVYFFTRYISVVGALKALKRENLYNLGELSSFYDVPAFTAKVNALIHIGRLKKKKQYLFYFTAANLVTMQNANRDDAVTLLNAKIAKYLEDSFFGKANRKKKQDLVICFNRGGFLVYFFTNEEHSIRHLVDEISSEIFKIAEDNQVHIYVQPFFGVTEIEGELNLFEAIENAGIARNVSERNFETLTFYHDSFRKRSSKEEIDEINDALANNEFVVFYQPKFNLNTRRFISSEALVRWDSKEHGLLPPSKFIPVVEAAGLIHEIDTFVFKRVCEDLNEAKRKGRRILPVSINFSLYEFYSSEFLNSIINILERYQINPAYIEIEITEATSRANAFTAISIIKKLRDRGIRVLMDDFGVGFSNIGNLRKIPFDAVKIDKSFIDDIATDLKSRAIVKFLIELCQANDLEVIAEGVDDKEQVEILRKLKCNTIQGFYYSKALPYKEYEKFLISNPFEKREGVR